MSDAKKAVELKRDNTMQVTAKEGIRLLKDAGAHDLLEMQGLKRQPSAEDETDESGVDVIDDQLGSPSKPRLQRISTMAVTAKEGEQFLKEQRFKGKHGHRLATANKPKLSKFTTMLQTKQEGEAFLAAHEESKAKDEEPASKKFKVINEQVDNKKGSNKRVSILQRTTKEGEELLKDMGHKDDDPDSGRRRTRSQTRGGPATSPAKRDKKANSTEEVSAGTNNGGKRGRKGRPRKEKNEQNNDSSKKATAEKKKDEDEDEGDEEDEDEAKEDEDEAKEDEDKTKEDEDEDEDSVKVTSAKEVVSGQVKSNDVDIEPPKGDEKN